MIDNQYTSDRKFRPEFSFVMMSLLASVIGLGVLVRLMTDGSSFTILVYITFALFILIAPLIGPAFIFSLNTLAVHFFFRSYGDKRRFLVKLALSIFPSFIAYPVIANMWIENKVAKITHEITPQTPVSSDEIMIAVSKNARFTSKFVEWALSEGGYQSVYVTKMSNLEFFTQNSRASILAGQPKNIERPIIAGLSECRRPKMIAKGFKVKDGICSKTETVSLNQQERVERVVKLNKVESKKFSVAPKKRCAKGASPYLLGGRKIVKYGKSCLEEIKHYYGHPEARILSYNFKDYNYKNAKRGSEIVLGLDLRSARFDQVEEIKLLDKSGRLIAAKAQVEYTTSPIPYSFRIANAGALYFGELEVKRKTQHSGYADTMDTMKALASREIPQRLRR